MSITLQEVTLNDKTLWLVADPGEHEGALCNTPEDFEHGRESYAHLFDDKRGIMRFYKKLGEFSDLKFTGVCQEVSQSFDAFHNLLNWSL